MTAITVANKDWSIISGVASALSGATIGGSDVFNDVTVSTSDEQAKKCQFKTHPVAVVRYAGSVEDHRPDDERAIVVPLEITVAAKVNTAGTTDESARLQEILRLMNAAKNAVEASPPAVAQATGDNNFYHAKIEWGVPKVDTHSRQPWAVCTLPVEIATNIDDATSH